MPGLANIFGNQSFPKFDALHAHCAMTIQFKQTSCREAYNNMKEAVEMWQPEPKAGGMYAVWDATEEESIWATRTTPTKHYVDDILFDYFGNTENFNDPGCRVEAKSRSQSLSYYDYSTNYCNMWNVFNTVKEMANVEVTTSDCKFKPATLEEAATTCAKY